MREGLLAQINAPCSSYAHWDLPMNAAVLLAFVLGLVLGSFGAWLGFSAARNVESSISNQEPNNLLIHLASSSFSPPNFHSNKSSNRSSQHFSTSIAQNQQMQAGLLAVYSDHAKNKYASAPGESESMQRVEITRGDSLSQNPSSACSSCSSKHRFNISEKKTALCDPQEVESAGPRLDKRMLLDPGNSSCVESISKSIAFQLALSKNDFADYRALIDKAFTHHHAAGDSAAVGNEACSAASMEASATSVRNHTEVPVGTET